MTPGEFLRTREMQPYRVMGVSMACTNVQAVEPTDAPWFPA